MYGIPYNVVGGTNFYARREIKDLLAYLKTIDNGSDELAVRRIINIPKRGIGATTLNKIADYAGTHNMNFYDAIAHANEYITGKTVEKLHDFDLMIKAFRAKQKMMSLEELIHDVIDVTEFEEYLKSLEEDDENNGSQDNDRRQNVQELIGKVISYEEKADEPTLSGFLEDVALVADIDNVAEGDERVLLMTLHSAKGLEFEHVYLAGLEEGTFPSYMTINAEDSDPMAMEEERRLAYVGITRAKKELTISCAHRRMVRGAFESLAVSRFVDEIPEKLLDRSGSSVMPSFLFEGGDTIDARQMPLRELVADPSYAVSNLFCFSSDGVPEEARIHIDFALQNVPDDYVIAFYGYHYDTDDERDVLTLEHNDISARSVLLYAEVVDINDDSIAMVLWIVTAVLAAGAILLCGEKHEKTGQ